MKVKELIERLNKLDKEKDIYIIIIENCSNGKEELYDRKLDVEAIDITPQQLKEIYKELGWL